MHQSWQILSNIQRAKRSAKANHKAWQQTIFQGILGTSRYNEIKQGESLGIIGRNGSGKVRFCN